MKKMNKAKPIMPIKKVVIYLFFELISSNKESIALEYRKGSNLATTI